MASFVRSTTVPGLFFTLLAACLPAIAQTGTSAEEAEAQRLRSIIRQYYAEQDSHDREEAAGLASRQEQKFVTLAGEDYLHEQVLLSGTQGIKALENMNQRLEDQSIAPQRRESDMIFHAEVRDGGNLVTSRSHSLKSLGKSQYVAVIELPGGDADIVLREKRWQLTLANAEPTSFLVTLNAVQNQPPELHLIPVPALKSTNWADFPAWLPPIGASPNPAPGS